MPSLVTPAVSVILPTYNRSVCVGRAIQSVLDQIYLTFELIIIDDGSTDDTDAVLATFQDPRMLSLKHPLNKGAAAARNTGMKAARGEYIAFIDSDDVWLREKLERQVNFLKEVCAKQSKRQEIGGCASYYQLCLPDHVVNRKINIEKDFYQQSLKGCNLSPGSTLLFKKECLDHVGYQDENLKRFEDWEWQIRFAHAYRWVMLSEVLAKVNVGFSSPSWATVQLALEHLEFFNSRSSQARPKHNKTSNLPGIDLCCAQKSPLPSRSFGTFFKALLKNPFEFLALLKDVTRRKIREFFN